MTDEEIYDSPRGWVNRHIREYVETDGRKGHHWQGVPTLLLTTRGRRTGKLRRSALIYGEDGGSYLVVASTGGGDHHPAWYLNVVANPDVGLQVGAEKMRALARTADDDEKPLLWEMMASIWPDYDKYQKRTARIIPVVVLDPL